MRRKAKRRKKSKGRTASFEGREGELYKKRKRYLQNNLEDPEIAEEISINSEDEYNLPALCHWVESKGVTPEAEIMIEQARELMEVQGKIDLLELRMKSIGVEFEKKLNALIVWTNRDKSISRLNKELYKRHNSIAYFGDSKKGNQRNSDNNQHW